MRLTALRGGLIAVVVVVALAAGLASTHGGASAQTPAADMVTTQLRPGWNLVGWMGPDTTPAHLFRAVRPLQVVAAWDEDADRYVWARRGGAVPPQIEQITRGQGLFLWLGGSRPVQWTRPASAEGMLLTLPPGSSLVGWAGLDETPVAEAVGRFGDALVAASWWDAETQSYGRYAPGAEESPVESALLHHGDALWVELSEERRWWQSGTARTRIVFGRRVADAQKAELRDEMEEVVAFFAERYGVEPPDFTLSVVPDVPLANASRRLIRLGEALDDPSYLPYALVHEYFHVLQFDWAPRSLNRAEPPMWLVEGAARFVEGLYDWDRHGGADDRLRAASWWKSLHVDVPLRDLESWDRFLAVGAPAYALGALATDWLVRRTAAEAAGAPFDPHAPGGLGVGPAWDAHMKYYQLRQSAFSWQAAFEDAFGIGVTDFYAAFDAYRAEMTAARLPHLADDADAPLLVFEGEVAAGATARVRAQFEEVQALFVDRLDSGPADYTMFAAADLESAAAAHLRVSGREAPPGFCGLWSPRHFVMNLACDTRSVTLLARHHAAHVRVRLAPAASLPSVSGQFCSRGPCWLDAATDAYAEAVSRAGVGVETLAETRGRSVEAARALGQPLRALENPAGLDAVGRDVARPLAFLAGEWLAERAGERSIFEYYRLLPSSRSWQEAFERAFDITVAEFYDAFAGYRAAGFTS
ncbi:MAG: hypothetical protein OXG38_10645 [Chloroflexi bacterium]|nr:hypothetical protein [Chloroflexota bacterium]